MAKGKPYTKETILASLRPYFEKGMSIQKACDHAGFEASTVYRWTQSNPDIASQIRALQGELGVKARENIKKAIESGDPQMSRWYLEKSKLENVDFNSRTETTVAGAQPFDLTIMNYATDKPEQYISIPTRAEDGGITYKNIKKEEYFNEED